MSSATTSPNRQGATFLGHPRGLATLFNVELWERFSYYGMRAILLYYLVDTVANGGLGVEDSLGQAVVTIYGAAVYLLSIVGGWAADRLIGARRCVLYGGVVIMAGHLCLAVPVAAFSWLGIALVALGTGLLKPNTATMVGHLYTARDPRRDSGFSIFYMSVNFGAFFAPFVVSFLRNHWGYHAGFTAAAVGMAIALALFVVGRRSVARESDVIPNPLKDNERRRVPLLIGGSILLVVALVGLARLWRSSLLEASIDAISLLSVIASVGYFVAMFRSPKVTPRERSHLRAYLPMWLAAVFFWMIFEQAAGKMADFAANRTDLSLGGLHVQPEWFQSVNPVAIVLLAPVMAALWSRRAGRFPSTPAKFAIGVALGGLSFVVLSAASAHYRGPSAPVFVLAGVFLIQTLGELCLSPVGLSATSALAPVAFGSQAMSLWYLSSATGQSLAAQLIRAMAGFSDTQFYLTLGLMALVVGVLLFIAAPWVNRHIVDAEPAAR
ncbi:peptide MFS transporter [Calidifontibacter sp. DB0510]|uniref:Peptide MFS transporter n=1 Tax=Metallococcus carri TaxID=1656884 RepID=A0A967B5K3_9MICO|nr:peptide MFS transporter [Metallococcus carri]NHN55046.1 peptide MFS transporter [Metallococcus carri]NOP37392.1 peptide MFS transporter [Calidifontibacter sp. DB2511S]